LHFLLIDAAITLSDHEHRHIIRFAPKDDAFGDLPKLYPQCIGGLLRRARCIVEHHRRMWMPSGLQKSSEAGGGVWKLHYSAKSGGGLYKICVSRYYFNSEA
jgi:hypothetical protein